MRIAYCASCHSYIVDMKLGVKDPVVCASCSESIGRNNVFPCDSLGKTIFAAVKVGGTVTLKDPKYLISIMSDVAPSLSRDIRVFSKALNSSCADLLIQAINSKDSEVELLTRKIKALLIDEEGLSDSWAEKICSGIVAANLYLNDVAPEKIEERVSQEEASQFQEEHSVVYNSSTTTHQNRTTSQPKVKERPGKTADAAKRTNANKTALLDSGFEKLDEKDWAMADTYFAIVLRNDPDNVDAYLGLAMEEGRCRSKSDFEREYTRPGSTLPRSKYVAKIRQIGNPGMQTWLKLLDDRRAAAEDSNRISREEARKKADSNLQESVLQNQRPNTPYVAPPIINTNTQPKRTNTAGKIIATLIGIIGVAFVIVLFAVIIPTKRYASAVRMLENRDYAGAYKIFRSISNFRDSSDQAAQIKKTQPAVASVGDFVTFGVYEQDNNSANGPEAIEWLVLEKNADRILVISRFALDCQPYSDNWRTSTWDTCSMRTWLNDTFLSTAFNSNQKSMIPPVNVDGSSTDANNEGPLDRVFLLSVAEMRQYFGKKTEIRCRPTAYAEAAGATIGWRIGMYRKDCVYCDYWIRSAGNSSTAKTAIDYQGTYSIKSVSNENTGVRPVMWITFGE